MKVTNILKEMVKYYALINNFLVKLNIEIPPNQARSEFVPFMYKSAIPNIEIPIGKDQKPDPVKLLKLINNVILK